MEIAVALPPKTTIEPSGIMTGFFNHERIFNCVLSANFHAPPSRTPTKPTAPVIMGVFSFVNWTPNIPSRPGFLL